MKSVRSRNETGALGGLEGLAFGVLVFVMGTLLVANAWAVVDAKLASGAAAREASRVYVESDNGGDAEAAARTMAEQALAGHGRQVTDISINAPFTRCGAVEVLVTASVPRVSLPLIGRGGGTTTVTSRHTEVVDPYRSGLSGSADC